MNDDPDDYVGVPLRPMLGQITRDITDVFSRLKDREFVCEFKYDGQVINNRR